MLGSTLQLRPAQQHDYQFSLTSPLSHLSVSSTIFLLYGLLKHLKTLYSDFSLYFLPRSNSQKQDVAVNVKTMKLEGFMADIPRYSILSHCWGHEEVTFQDLSSGHFQHLKGYQKLAGCCELSQREGFAYTWIDTCCIDKSSSAELTEAINSMFTWYKDSSVCYTYMEDVGNENPRDPGSLFAKSKWFTRGWTLQELIAPDVVVFLSSTWRELGTRVDLAKTISNITGINLELFLPGYGERDIKSLLDEYSIACRMSWAANRQTTRVEDVAYCLMGLFDINMPLLCGEGDKAFIRLQKEIVNSSNDFSIFAWHTQESERLRMGGMLAPSPSAFERCRDVSPSGHNSLPQSTFEVYKFYIKMQVTTIEMGSPKEYLNLLVRQEIGSGRLELPQDVRTVLKTLIGSKYENKEAFVAVIPCNDGRHLIGILLLKHDVLPLERYGRVLFQEFSRKPPKLSIFQVQITTALPLNRHFLETTIRLAANCLYSQSDYTTSKMSNFRSVADPTTFFLKKGTTGSLFIKVIDNLQPCPDFVVFLDNRDNGKVLCNCVAVPDTHNQGSGTGKGTQEIAKQS